MFAWLTSTGSSSTGVDAASWRIRLNLTWLAAAKCHRCSRRFSGSIAAAMCFTILGGFKRFTAVGWSDGVLRGGGVRRVVRRGPNRSVMYAESEELHYIWAWLESDARYGGGHLGGGSYFWKGGSRKGGFGRTPRTPPGYGPEHYISIALYHPGSSDGLFALCLCLSVCFCVLAVTTQVQMLRASLSEASGCKQHMETST